MKTVEKLPPFAPTITGFSVKRMEYVLLSSPFSSVQDASPAQIERRMTIVFKNFMD
jgi:hypothetical protein